MLDLAINESESWDNYATGNFKSFFPVHLGNTEEMLKCVFASLMMRLTQIMKASFSWLWKHLFQVLKRIFSRGVGAETHGTRPVKEPWRPNTGEEFVNYIEGCCNRLIDLSKRKDEVGAAAKQGLGNKFRYLANKQFLKVVKRAVEEVVSVHGAYWPEAYESLGDVLVHDIEGHSAEYIKEIQAILKLSPQIFRRPPSYPSNRNAMGLPLR